MSILYQMRLQMQSLKNYKQVILCYLHHNKGSGFRTFFVSVTFVLFIINGRRKIGNGDLVLIIIAFLIGFINDKYGPQEYHYEGTRVVVDRKYQCPKHCAVNHHHNVYFESETDGMIIDKNKLGKKIKKKKKKQLFYIYIIYIYIYNSY